MDQQDRIDQFIIELYRTSRRLSADKFKGWVFKQLHALLDFDSGIWGTGTLEYGAHVHSIYLDNQPMEMVINYEQFKNQDPLNVAHVEHPNITCNLYDLIPRKEFIQLPVYKEHAQVYGMEHALSTARSDSLSAVLSIISFYRSSPDHPFTEADRLLKQRITPFIFEAYTACLFIHLNIKEDKDYHENTVGAVCDKRGILYQVENGFIEQLNREWPEWIAPKLPDEIISHMNNQEKDSYPYPNYEITITPFNELYYIKLSEYGPLKELTPREREIVSGLKDGLSYKQLARRLEISPSTITNHANNIYRKLGIDGRKQLTNLH